MKTIGLQEIGSEFHYEPLDKGNCAKRIVDSAIKDEMFVFSGRTAIETVLKNTVSVKKALLPSYCCQSMTEPFQRQGISISFYPVIFDTALRIDLSIPDDIDLVLWCNYFGFNVPMPDFTRFLNRGGILVEDITHSFFSRDSFHPQSNYLVASVRKWLPLVSGGYCASLNDGFVIKPTDDIDESFLHKKTTAMMMKKEYLETADISLKANFLSLFSESNTWLANNYSNLKIDSYSLQKINGTCIDEIRQKRINNASVIYKRLLECDSVSALFSIDRMDCPLFVPIVFKNPVCRDNVRKKLIENNIYCPIHWPRPSDCNSNLYDRELSLICDQRYNADSMNRMMDIIIANI